MRGFKGLSKRDKGKIMDIKQVKGGISLEGNLLAKCGKTLASIK